MGAVVRAFDVRAAAREQVEAAGAEFLTVALEEDGSGAGGYAKEMSPAFIEAEMALFAAQCKECDVVITTALIPGKPAPKLISAAMVASMKPGSVCVDLAAEAGGNVETTVPGASIRTANGVTCVGYTDLPSRCAGQASAMFSNNVANFLLSLGDAKQRLFKVDPEADEAVRGALVTSGGAAVWPLPPLPKVEVPKPPPKPEPPVVLPVLVPKPDAQANAFKETLRDALLISLALGALLAVGAAGPSAAMLSLVTIFLLACVVGFQVVAGVAPALHSPLMSVTNAVSGMTALGGLQVMTGGFLPTGPLAALAAAAVLLSAVNIAGGFVMTARMLDMFRRPTDPVPETRLFAIPLLLSVGGYAAAVFSGAAPPALHAAAGLASALCCIGAIGGLASQETARAGNALGVIGVSLGIASTLGALVSGGLSAALGVQMLSVLAVGGAAGFFVAVRTAITDLPQLVAAFHSLVGLAAAITGIVSFALHPGTAVPAIWAGTLIGGITFTGSIVAFMKLNGQLSSKAFSLPAKDAVNLGLFLACVACLLPLLAPATPVATCLAALGATAGLSMLLGTHMTTAIGGADSACLASLPPFAASPLTLSPPRSAGGDHLPEQLQRLGALRRGLCALLAAPHRGWRAHRRLRRAALRHHVRRHEPLAGGRAAGHQGHAGRQEEEGCGAHGGLRHREGRVRRLRRRAGGARPGGCQARAAGARLRPGGGQGPALGGGAHQPAARKRQGAHRRHPPRRGPHARPAQRAARGGWRALRPGP
jgi:NAD(P) transhydrogenase